MLASFETPAGGWIRMEVRDGTSDWNTVNAITKVGDEYHLPAGRQGGWAVDVGAHIGAWTVALLVDNPGMRAIAIEALPENVVLIERNLRLNDLADRAVVICAAASSTKEPVAIGYGEVADPTLIHEFIGNARAPEGSRFVRAPGVTLEDVLALVEAGQGTGVDLLKIDCEGCEFTFLASPAIGRVRAIEGEHHGPHQRIRELLDPTHDLLFPGLGDNPDFGPFSARLRA